MGTSQYSVKSCSGWVECPAPPPSLSPEISCKIDFRVPFTEKRIQLFCKDISPQLAPEDPIALYLINQSLICHQKKILEKSMQ